MINLEKRFLKMNVMSGFTLAEVLITLGIIGVVAAITIPIISTKVQEQEYKTAYKKAFSIASQVSSDLYNNYEFHAATEGDYNFNLFKSKFKVAKECLNNNNAQCWAPDGEMACTGSCGGGTGEPYSHMPAFVDSSGMVWSLFDSGHSWVLVDTNGMKKPNKYGRDRWIMLIDSVSTSTGKLKPGSDITTLNTLNCHYPPCYPTSWLYK